MLLDFLVIKITQKIYYRLLHQKCDNNIEARMSDFTEWEETYFSMLSSYFFLFMTNIQTRLFKLKIIWDIVGTKQN